MEGATSRQGTPVPRAHGEPGFERRAARRHPGVGLPEALFQELDRDKATATLAQLLRAGRDPNCTIDSNVPPIIHAIKEDWTEGAALLVHFGAMVDNRGASDSTALGHAIENDWRGSTTFLLQHGADPRKATPEYESSLSFAVDRGSIRALRALLEFDIPVNETDGQGRTALMVAAQWGDRDVAEELLRAGALTELKDRAGDNARDYAEQYGHKEFLAWFTRRMFAVPHGPETKLLGVQGRGWTPTPRG